MSFIGDLFGGGDAPAAPKAQSPAPKISDAMGMSAALENASRQQKRYGVDDTILTGGLGDSLPGETKNVNRTTALGGNSSLAATI